MVVPAQLPNCLSAARLAMAPVLIWFAWAGWAQAFLVLLVVAFVTDALDGQLARRFNLSSELGARLDTWGDVAIYLSLIICSHLLWPDIMRGERAFIVLALVSVALPGVASLLKFRTLTSYHTWLMKGAALLLLPGCLMLFLGGPNWLFRLACVLCFIAAVENVLITLSLPRPRTNVKSLWHVLRN